MNNLDLFRRDFVLSIRPQYAERIVDGSKTVELRRRFPYGTVTSARLYVYATVPVQALLGYATIQIVERTSVEDIWRLYSEVAWIERDDFLRYYDGASEGYVVHLRDPVRLRHPVPLDELRSTLGFTPPQSFTYADEALHALVEGR